MFLLYLFNRVSVEVYLFRTKKMASFGGVVSARSSSSSFFQNMKKDSKKRNHSSRLFKINCVSTFSADPYKTLSISKGASEAEVKKAFRRLALQYHPDVCKGSNCGVEFHQINEAYDAVIASLREEEEEEEEARPSWDNVPSADEAMRGMFDPDYDMWEEWMGWEGAGIRDYSSHINPYI